MRILVIVACFAVAACASGPTTTEISQRCGANTKTFAQSWPCVRAGTAGIQTYADLRDLYIATGDYIAAQVAEGKMTDAEAKMAMAQAQQRINDSVSARNDRSTTDAVVLGTILNRPQQQPAPVFTAPRATVNCWRIGDSVQCY